ncbi:MAG: hypothetical protein QXJ28_01130 [Candidatus Pacearchaeota archaeon]
MKRIEGLENRIEESKDIDKPTSSIDKKIPEKVEKAIEELKEYIELKGTSKRKAIKEFIKFYYGIEKGFERIRKEARRRGVYLNSNPKQECTIERYESPTKIILDYYYQTHKNSRIRRITKMGRIKHVLREYEKYNPD